MQYDNISTLLQYCSIRIEIIWYLLFFFTNEALTLSWLISSDLVLMRHCKKLDSGSNHCRPQNTALINALINGYCLLFYCIIILLYSVDLLKSTESNASLQVNDKTNNPISSNSHPLVTANKAMHTLKKRGEGLQNWILLLGGILRTLLTVKWPLHVKLTKNKYTLHMV